MKRHLQRLATFLLAGIFLAPGWFPLSVLSVEGTEMIRADHGCACGKFTGCCCELFAPTNRQDRSGDACRLRSRRGDNQQARHAGHGTHGDHGTHEGTDSDGTHHDADRVARTDAGVDAGSFCAMPFDSRDVPVERPVTLDFRTLVGPLLASAPGLTLSPTGFLISSADRSPATLARAPETPPPIPFFVPA